MLSRSGHSKAKCINESKLTVASSEGELSLREFDFVVTVRRERARKQVALGHGGNIVTHFEAAMRKIS